MAAIRTAVQRVFPARIAALCLSLAMTGAVLAQSPATADPVASKVAGGGLAPPPGALVAPGEFPDLTFLHTGYVVGYIEPCG